MPDPTPFEIATPSGHRFAVMRDPDRPGRYDMTWLTGPNEGYGFSSQSSERSTIGVETLRQMCEDFVAEVNPATGYLK